MIRNYELSPLPVALSPREAKPLLYSLARTALAGVAIHDCGETLEESIKNIQPFLPPTISLEPVNTIYSFSGHSRKAFGQPLHWDALPPIKKQKTMPLTFHFTEKGTVTSTYFLAGPAFQDLQPNSEREDEIGAIIYELYKKGKVDTDLLSYKGFKAWSKPGTLIVFKSGEPYAHEFIGEQSSRQSYACDGSIEISSGMKVTRSNR